MPRATAVGIVGDRICAVGTDDEVLAAIDDRAERVDLHARALLPGFVDAHFHLLGYCLDRGRIHLDGLPTLAATLDAIRYAVEQAPADTWMLGRGWNQNLWPTHAFPTRHDLDRVTGPRPACLLSHDVHAVWANTAALRLAGIGRATPDSAGGRIVREADGEPSGILLEAAGERVRALADRPTLESAVAAVRRGQDELLRVGVTGLHNLEGALSFRALQTLEAAGELRLRVFAGIQRSALAAAVEVGLQSGFGGDRLRVGLLKLFADGALGSGTAALLAPYEDDASNTGIATLERDELAGLVREARAAGIGVATHAIGDAAVRTVLDAAELARADDPAHRQVLRIEHAQLVHPADIPRFAQLGVVASMQPLHATSDMRIADRRWGTRCESGYPWRALLDAGAHLAFGTDCPVEPPDPLLGIHAAVTRERDGEPVDGWYPEQRLGVAEAIRAYTIGSASAAGVDPGYGSIAPGRLADLVVLSRDPYTTPAAELGSIRVEMAVFAGEIAYAA
jgi:predicted amidohydrolase YtcJ